MKWLLLALISASYASAQSCPTFTKADEYRLSQVLVTWGTDFRISTPDGTRVGKVVEKKLHLATTFELRNAEGELVASAQKRILAIGTKIDIYDCNEIPIGSLQKDILKSLVKVLTTYSLLDANGLVVGQSGKLDLFSTDINLRSPSDQPLAEVHRPWVNILGDTWTVQLRSGEADARLVLLMPAFKTSADSNRD